MYRANIFSEIHIVNLINDFSITKNKDYWNLKFNSVIYEIKFRKFNFVNNKLNFNNFNKNINHLIKFSDIQNILNGTCLVINITYDVYDIIIYNKETDKYNKYELYPENIEENICFWDQFIFNLLPYSSLEIFLYCTRFSKDTSYPYFKGIPKTLKLLMLSNLYNINLEKYKDQLKKIKIIDGNYWCGNCGGFLNLDILDEELLKYTKYLQFNIDSCDCYYYDDDRDDHDHIHYLRKFYIKNLQLCEYSVIDETLADRFGINNFIIENIYCNDIYYD
jgi:hypothetical protein